MNIEHDLRDALRRKAAPPDLADRVMARIERGEAGREDTPSSSGNGALLRIADLKARRRDTRAVSGGSVRIDVRDSWLDDASDVELGDNFS
jgi:hypothetical protein